jgi:hypothetical protein
MRADDSDVMALVECGARVLGDTDSDTFGCRL